MNIQRPKHPEKASPSVENAPIASPQALEELSLNVIPEKVQEHLAEGKELKGDSAQGTQVQQENNTSSAADQKTQNVSIPLPTPEKQKKAIEKAIKARTRYLAQQAIKYRNSPSKLEEIVLEIRYLQKILYEMMHYTLAQIKQLYKKFVRS